MDIIEIFNYIICFPDRGKTGCLCCHYVNTDTEVCTQLLNTWSNKLHNFIIYITILEYCSDNRKSYVLWTDTFYWLSCHVDSNNTWHINIVSLV